MNVVWTNYSLFLFLNHDFTVLNKSIKARINKKNIIINHKPKIHSRYTLR